MGKPHVVRHLDDGQFSFVIESIINGLTDQEISAAFKAKFDKPLAKSSLNRWRNKAGNELAERYRIARYQARQLMSALKEEDSSKYQVVIENIEDRLLSSMREMIAQDPIKLLQIRQEEEKRRLKERELTLKERVLRLAEEKQRGEQIDRAALPGEIIEHLFNFIGSDAPGLTWFKKNAKKLENYLIEKYAQKAS